MRRDVWLCQEGVVRVLQRKSDSVGIDEPEDALREP